MTDMFSRPISHARAIANVLVAAVLVAVLVGLVINIAVDRASKNVSAASPKRYV